MNDASKRRLCVVGDCTILEAMQSIDQGGVGAVCLVDGDGHMLGIVTDGDIRKAILHGVDTKMPLSHIINRNYIYGDVSQSHESHLNKLRQHHRRHLPILDSQGHLVDIVILDEVSFQRIDTLVVLMVGGLGSRLGALTTDCPKPMLKIGNKPILERIIEKFIQQGFYRFVLCVNYKADIIKKYFNDGTDLDVQIMYTEEEQRMGTAGALGLLAEKPTSPFIVMNGDLMTDINYKSLLEFHEQQSSIATMAVRQYDLHIPYGVIEHQGSVISGIKEKPVYSYYINAGIYVLDPKAFDYIPENKYFDMTSLFARFIANKEKTSLFPTCEHWLDIGRPEDYAKANIEYDQ